MIKGIILAGGSGTRLYPATSVISKQLLPIFDKPMVYYPLSVLMLAGIRDILIISTPRDLPLFHQLLGDGSKWGLQLSYLPQMEPRGLAEAFIIGKQFIGKSRCAMILGDNLFYGGELTRILRKAISHPTGATIFAYQVNDPERYGVIAFDKNERPVSIEEKPKKPKSRYAITGLYFYDNRVVEFVEDVKPSKRGELEIVDLHKRYLELGELEVVKLGRGMAWLDTGTFESYLDASIYIETIEKRQGIQIACLEEIAYRLGYITAEQVREAAHSLEQNLYGKYLLNLLDGDG